MTPAEHLAADRERLVEATDLAWRWHGTQTRKGRATSYMTHLLGVQAFVIAAGGDSTCAIAALLHDGLEDAENPPERAAREALIETRFGSQVLEIVLDCTDTTPNEAGEQKGPWRERKERYLEQLRSAAASSLLVAACDKRQNLEDLVRDLEMEGPETLARFNAGAAEQLWYFESLADVCRTAIPEDLATTLDTLVERFGELSGA